MMDDFLLPKTTKPSQHIRPSKSLSRLDDTSQEAHVSQSYRHAALKGLANSLQGVNSTWLSWKDGKSAEEKRRVRRREDLRQIIIARMTTAESYAAWERAARDLDDLEGNDAWKRENTTDATTGDLNPELIAARLRELDDARASCDIRAMMHLIRTALSRDLGGMGSVDLYRHSYSGTKELIEKYVASALATIEAVVNQGSVDATIEFRDLLDSMLHARQSFGRSALLLSGGGTFGMAHTGVLKALFEAKLLPRIISGASAGSIVCAVLCTRTDEEIPELMEEFSYGDLAVFEEEGGDEGGVLGHLKRLLTKGSWSDIKHLTRVMRNMTSDLTFQEAYNRTRRILNICVSTESVYELPRLLNYVTAPNVLIWSAVAASCSVPLVFNASPLLVKDPVTGAHLPWNPSPQKWIDGSVDNDLPMTRLAEMFNVNHFIVSQVNPHVIPFLSRDDHLSPSAHPDARAAVPLREDLNWVHTLTALARDEAMHRLDFLAELGILSNLATKARSILSQKYSGDINILPEIGMEDLPRLLSNPTTDFMVRMAMAGEKATWPKLARVRDRCAIELGLDRAVHRLRTRVVFSESQRDLRKLRGVSLGAAGLGGKGMKGFEMEKPKVNVGGEVLAGNIGLRREPGTGVKIHESSETTNKEQQHRGRRRSGGSLHLHAERRQILSSLDGAEGSDGQPSLRANTPSAPATPLRFPVANTTAVRPPDLATQLAQTQTQTHTQTQAPAQMTPEVVHHGSGTAAHGPSGRGRFRRPIRSVSYQVSRPASTMHDEAKRRA